MSLEVLNWAWEQACPNPTSKLVLMALADHANADGECWPSMKRIAALTGISPRQVSTHITQLCDLGYVEKADRRRRDGQYRGWDYVVRFQRKFATSGSTLPVTSGSQASSPAEVGFRSEPSENRQGEPLAAAPRDRQPDPLWDAMLAACGINGKTITKTGRGQVNAALKELREIGATPADIDAKAKVYRKTWPDASLTPSALVKHWAALATKAEQVRRTCECGQPLDNHSDEVHDILMRGGL